MKKASATSDTSRRTQIAILERAVAQLLSQLTALERRVGALEVAHTGQQKTRALELITVAEDEALVPPPEAELLAVRLAKIRLLIESLEAQCSQSTEQRDTFGKLKRELDEAGQSSTPVSP